MITRRGFLITASAALVYAPAVVKAVNLMPLRGIILPIDRNYFGYVDRLYIHSHFPRIAQLKNNGLSFHEIAGEMNRLRRTAMNGRAWNAQHVIFVLKHNEQIKRTDAIIRAERALL